MNASTTDTQVLRMHIARLRAECSKAKATLLAARPYIPESEAPYRWTTEAIYSLAVAIQETGNGHG